MTKPIRTLSLFSGGGGLDIGFEKAGFQILFATDINHECCETLKINKGITLNADLIVEEQDITTMDFDVLPKDIDMIIGGPPCQSFSASGRRAGGAAGKLDARGNLFTSYCKVVALLKPKAFLFENVRGILGTNKGKDFKEIVSAFLALGYKIQHKVLDAEDYGVPQQRERMFIVGHKMDKPFLYPRPIYGPDSREGKAYVSVYDAIKDLPFTEQDKQETKFDGGKYSELLPLVPPGENYLYFTAKRGYPEPIFAYRSRFSDFLYKANPNYPVKTLIASPGKYTGPLHWDNRYFTVSEYKRIQGFPDEHVLFGDRVAQIRQIGNSVCPKIAYYMALAIREQIFGIPLPSKIDYLQTDAVLSFDKRKSQKANRTKAIHLAVKERNLVEAAHSFTLTEFETYVKPSTIKKDVNTTVKVDRDSVVITVKCDPSRRIEAKLSLTVFDGVNKDREIQLTVVVYGNGNQDIQTMWNAVDAWVKKTSNFKSLIELYGHFTEPHPIFRVDSFEIRTDLPSFQFAKHCMDFRNCSKYFPKEHLLKLWGNTFDKDSFVDLASTLRSYRFDVRCHETNIAIPQGVYMVAYPFSLPYDKQMNFTMEEKKMGKKKDTERPADLDAKIIKELDSAYELADTYFATKNDALPVEVNQNLSPRFITALESIAKNCQKAQCGYLNVITGLSIKAVCGDKVDVRYHQVQIQNQTDRPAGFNFRGVSEKVIHEWMEKHEFRVALSGWQTRTYERPKPYLLTYDENIGTIKGPFLTCYDEVETNRQDAHLALYLLLWRHIQLRDASKITLTIPKNQDVLQITNLFERHFFYKYKNSEGASRLPVLALYAIYKVLLSEVQRYNGKGLKDLKPHSAADSQTGAIGDIEVVNPDGSIFEAVEVKHDISITKAIVNHAKQKIRGSQVDRYYILTTYPQHEPSDDIMEEVENAKKMLGCQMIVNGVIPTIKYYLRLLSNPDAVLPEYVKVLASDRTVKFEHRDIWNKIATGVIK